ncbi:hypothetical protein OIU78_014936 [Salix suchowensis]|nr:hypothetical protein OIU78_014936 [Salix suchowensis]
MDVQKEPVSDLQLHQVLRMNDGDGDNSYSNNSLFQKKVILKAKPILQEAIVQLCSKSFPECITMADMGCSSGPNTFLPIWEVMEAIDETCRKLNRKNPILQVFLNDLPGNDFNSIFRSLPSFRKKLEEEMGGEFGPCFIAAMPGSFYGKALSTAFPSLCSFFLQSPLVPEIPLNKGNIYLSKTSPPGVHKAYLNQFEKDFTAFLRSRSEEMIPGGCMVLTICGRDEINDSSGNHSPPIWEFFGMMLNDMVLEGLIEESKLDSFNMPFYAALAEEVKYVIQAEKSFTIIRVESFHVSWDASIDDRCRDTMDVAKGLRAITEAILARHFGDEIVDVMFQRFSTYIGEYMETFKRANTSHVVSMIKA